MATLLDRALEQVSILPQDEQDAIAFQILDFLADAEVGLGHRALAVKDRLI